MVLLSSIFPNISSYNLSSTPHSQPPVKSFMAAPLSDKEKRLQLRRFAHEEGSRDSTVEPLAILHKAKLDIPLVQEVATLWGGRVVDGCCMPIFQYRI